MLIEVAGVATRNKGAELMLEAVRQHYAGRPDVELVVESSFGTYQERGAYGLRTKLGPMKVGRASIAAAAIPRWYRKSLGLANEADISAVLDASGFAFGDQLGARRSEMFAKDVLRWKKQGKPVVLLPQALGPFETDRVRQAFRIVMRHADLVFARDRVSLQHLERLNESPERVRIAPDFTKIVAGMAPEGFVPPQRWACVVPNHRMVEKTSPEVQAQYIPFLAQCIRQLHQMEIECRVLLHDVHIDRELIAPLNAALGVELPVLQETNPAKLKGILGTAHVVLGSRFHALVGALSQCVPTVAVGWSHKYAELLSDYGCDECVLSPLAEESAIRKVFKLVLDEPSRSGLIGRIRERGGCLKEDVRMMWREVDQVLGIRENPSGEANSSSAPLTPVLH